jgi:hypothetical protein
VPVRLRQPGDRLRQAALRFHRSERLFRGGGLGGSFDGGLAPGSAGGAAAAGAGEVAQNGGDPRAQRLIQAGRVLPGRDEGVLEQVLGDVGIAHLAAGQGAGPAGVGHQSFELRGGGAGGHLGQGTPVTREPFGDSIQPCWRGWKCGIRG